MEFDHEKFLGSYRNTWSLDENRTSGLDQLLGFIASDDAVTDVRWAAYMLATVKHECANRWQPIEEFGKGAGKDYGKPVAVTDADGEQHAVTYFGRGYVQLTWKANYEKMGTVLGDDLVIHPELALDPQVAYRIMSYGMLNGSFTGKKLSDYINDAGCDYKNARRIINGLDQWALIKGYAEALESMLRDSTPS